MSITKLLLTLVIGLSIIVVGFFVVLMLIFGPVPVTYYYHEKPSPFTGYKLVIESADWGGAASGGCSSLALCKKGDDFYEAIATIPLQRHHLNIKWLGPHTVRIEYSSPDLERPPWLGHIKLIWVLRGRV